MTPLLPHFQIFADVFKHLCFVLSVVARLNKGACDALMFSMGLWIVFFIFISFF